MAVISRAGDFFYALRFLRLLTTPFEKTKAFKFGIIDKNGKVFDTFASMTNPTSNKFIKVIEKALSQ